MTAIEESRHSSFDPEYSVSERLVWPRKRPLGYYRPEGLLMTQSGRRDNLFVDEGIDWMHCSADQYRSSGLTQQGMMQIAQH